MSSSTCFRVLGLLSGVLLIALSGLLSAADVEPDSDVELTLGEGDRDFTNSVGMKLVRIPRARFMMGGTDNEPQGNSEKPRHRVELTRDFHLGVHEVTQKQYEKVMGKNPSWFSKNAGGATQVQGVNTDDFPVEMVSWNEAQEFCKKLNALASEKSSRRVYRLPTEAEWEYACRGGPDVKEQFTLKKPTDTLAAKQANFAGAGLSRTCKVGSYEANPFGLYDMHGNVVEWCQDWFGAVYDEKDRKDPTGARTGSYRIARGGAWIYEPTYCRSAFRNYTTPDQRMSYFGFRVACDVRQ